MGFDRMKRAFDFVAKERQRCHFLLGIPFVICSQWVRLCFGPLVFVCAVAIPATVSSLCVPSRAQGLSFPRACVVWPHWFLERFSCK